MTLIYLVTLALLFDVLFGDPHSSWHPVALFGRAASPVERFCRRKFRSEFIAGFAGWVILVGGATAATWLLVRLLVSRQEVAGVLLAAVILYFTIALRSLVDHARAIRRPLRNGNLSGARRALSMIVSRDTAALSESEIVRGAIESLGENLIDAMTSALFFAVLGYLVDGVAGAAAGAVFLRAANTLDACWGYRNRRYLLFGRFAARADDVLHFIPARLTLPAIAAAALLLRLDAKATLKAGIRHRHDHPSPNSCWGMAGFAGALGIRLGGPTVYDGVREPYPYWGEGRKKLNCADLVRAEYLTVFSALVFAVVAAGLGVWLS
ncbi:adenosylcobinamide-phosphate synthase CbiB [uncultured Victivallis sp.]|uniref:adenosylcobinamide-phosphate synthase CbiB n=1 Tax=uncultured Victivallis sp. TaxID=354118 RepID=UPI0025FFE79B|nr:adenosylcobinamide-phosphate synthase CbiB [uncultured Victivallis sp.]